MPSRRLRRGSSTVSGTRNGKEVRGRRVIARNGAHVPLCPMKHDMIAWSGPPHNNVQMYVCLRCNAYASETMIKDMGYDFGNVPDYVIHDLMDEVLRVRAKGTFTFHT